ncbi:hypothetical protein POTOM_002865 [Populus tomentosa]|uniref:Uncharacterized protein n=1 Tax=Populus tomentosa TaxID=118781 RepID=A0A8X8DKM3_POPTO|nr:hypothetical protein POTOM_002865 [Populus tomentosa]
MQTQSFNAKRGHFKVAVSGSVTRLQPIERRINLNRKQSPSIIYAAAMNARCAASGQTQTLTNKAPGVTKAPQRVSVHFHISPCPNLLADLHVVYLNCSKLSKGTNAENVSS